MCGRYSLAPDESVEIARIVAEVQARFGATSIHTGDIYPTNAAPVLLSNGQEMTPKPMGWGFPSFKGKGVIINARGETALDKPMFRKSLLERRCIVPTTGFYEWSKDKTKYRFNLPGRDTLYLAGLWNSFQGEERYVVLTTAPNDTIINVHDRMPALLTEEELTPWLNDAGMATAKVTALQPSLTSIAV